MCRLSNVTGTKNPEMPPSPVRKQLSVLHFIWPTRSLPSPGCPGLAPRRQRHRTTRCCGPCSASPSTPSPSGDAPCRGGGRGGEARPFSKPKAPQPRKGGGAGFIGRRGGDQTARGEIELVPPEIRGVPPAPPDPSGSLTKARGWRSVGGGRILVRVFLKPEATLLPPPGDPNGSLGKVRGGGGNTLVSL